MRIVMMGTGPFAVPTFQSLLDSSHDVLALITRPPPRGQGHHRLTSNPMELLASKGGLRTEFPESINDESSLVTLDELAADLFVVCDYGQILSADALGRARLGGINLHASLLPRYRGAAPINWAIYEGCKETGVTVIHMTPRLDSGPSLIQRPVAIRAGETAIQLEGRLAAIGVPAVHAALEQLMTWDGHSEIGRPQSSADATRAPRLKKSDGRVDWSRSAIQIADQVRAFKPWPGTYSFWPRANREPLRVVLDEVLPCPATTEAVDSPPGTVLQAGGNLVISTGDGALQVKVIQPAGRKLQPAEAFLRGYRIAVGERFGCV